MAIPLIPWEPHVFPKPIQDELNRRTTNRGFNYIGNSTSTWTNSDDDWNSYKGPMTSWVRMCSNGYGLDSIGKPGFVFYGGKDFYSAYGFNSGITFDSNDDNQSVIGFTPSGEPHVIGNSLVDSGFPIHVPPPEIDKVSANIQKEILRRVSVEWTCFSFKQLEYMTPYFLVPGISVIIEWGWNHFNPLSLLDLGDEKKLKDLFNNPYPLYTDNILRSKGNYEVLFGIITNFEWSIDGNKIKCRTEITSKDRIWAGQIVNANTVINDTDTTDTDNKEKVLVLDSLTRFVVEFIDKFKDLIPKDSKDGEKVIQSYINAPDTDKDKSPLKGFIKYMVEESHPKDYKEYLFGLFYGRDEEVVGIGRSIPSGGGPGQANAQPIEYATKAVDPKYSSEDDFDHKGERSPFWINMGLIVEIINFHSRLLQGVKNQPMFKVNVDDCIISGHPNLISTNGNVLLIPNALAPKYFYGVYGENSMEKWGGVTKGWGNVKFSEILKQFFSKSPSVSPATPEQVRASGLSTLTVGGTISPLNEAQMAAAKDTINVGLLNSKYGTLSTQTPLLLPPEESINSSNNQDDYTSKMKPSDYEATPPLKSSLKKLDREKGPDLKYADFRLYRICNLTGNMARRDDLNKVINMHRFNSLLVPSDPGNQFEFPFSKDYDDITDGSIRTYSKYYTGLFKNLYFNSEAFKQLVKNQYIVTYQQLYQQLFEDINSAASNFWRLRVVTSTGRDSTQESPTQLATMKIVDDNLSQYTSNTGEQPYMFDYYASDGILQAITFRPQLSNAQAIRTIYAQTNAYKKKKIVLSDENQLLDYKFKDRLFRSSDDSKNTGKTEVFQDSSFKASMTKIQSIKPLKDAFQMTIKSKDESKQILRLAIPSSNSELLTLLLDDNDKYYNPRYLGIMPNIQAEFTLQGIAGIRTFSIFRVRGLPEPYSENNIIFRTINVNDNLQNGQWTTQIIAGVMPLRGYFANRLSLSPQDKIQIKKNSD